MFAVIYRSYIKKGSELNYQNYWKTIATYFINERGALSSTLHQGEEGMWIAYSKWPNQATRDASWPVDKMQVNSLFPSSIQEAIKGLYDCLEKQLPEICMEIVQEIHPHKKQS